MQFPALPGPVPSAGRDPGPAAPRETSGLARSAPAYAQLNALQNSLTQPAIDERAMAALRGCGIAAERWNAVFHDQVILAGGDGDSTCATIVDVTTVGLRELRQNASELVRRVESGEEIEITVAGRPGARLVPVRPRAWRTYDEIAGLFAGRPDTDWQADREQIDQALRDPWGDE